MKRKYFCLFFYLGLFPALLQARETIDFNRGWKFIYGDICLDSLDYKFDVGYVTVNLPHDFPPMRLLICPIPLQMSKAV